MAPSVTLETFSFNPFIVNENMNDNNQDPNLNFFHESISSSFDADYVSTKDFKSKFKDYSKNSFSVLRLNIRSLSKDFESFKELCNLLSFKFSIVCLSETWSKEKVNENSLYQPEGYNSLHQNRKHKNGGGVALFVKDSCSFKKRDDLSINSEAIESLSIEIKNNEYKNIIFNVVYWPPDGDIDVCENYFKNIFFKDNVIRKNILLAGDFNINLLYFEENKKVQNFINLIFQFGLVPTTNK